VYHRSVRDWSLRELEEANKSVKGLLLERRIGRRGGEGSSIAIGRSLAIGKTSETFRIRVREHS